VVAHNFVPCIVITLSWLFGAGTAVEWSIVGGIIAAGVGVLGCAMNKNDKKKKVTVTPVVSIAMPNPIDPDDDKKEKERKFNEMSKTEFFKKVKEDYRYDKQAGLYRRIKDKEGLRCSRTNKEIEYLKWDGQHGDVEAYAANEAHLGSIRPSDYVMYRDPDVGRRL
jgi:hypothetical protein